MKNNQRITRRHFLHSSSATAAAGAFLYEYINDLSAAHAAEPKLKNERLRLGAIGVGGRGRGIMRQATRYADLIAVADADLHHAEKARERAGGKAKVYQDYRELLEKHDLDVVTIGSPDHWHTRMCIDAMRAGIDVYCEKPLTLTIDEGKDLAGVVRDTGRILQVGTQQRSEFGGKFLVAIALVRAGRIGRLKRVTAAIGAGPKGGPFKVADPPTHLNWDAWLGQAPDVPYLKERCHGTFRWWYEYSGGKMTDWGAHHVDIAHLGMGMEHTGPLSIEGTAEHQNIPNGYNTAMTFDIRAMFPNDLELVIRHRDPKFGNGILFEGSDGHVFVNRGTLKGTAVEVLKDNPLPEDAIVRLYKGEKPGSHMANFFASVRSRNEPMGDVFTHHRALSTCHLANISIRLGRKITWDAVQERIVGDDEADAMRSRPQRSPYQYVV